MNQRIEMMGCQIDNVSMEETLHAIFRRRDGLRLSTGVAYLLSFHDMDD